MSHVHMSSAENRFLFGFEKFFLEGGAISLLSLKRSAITSVAVRDHGLVLCPSFFAHGMGKSARTG